MIGCYHNIRHERACLLSGVVEISPSGVAPVCQIGDPLELTCNTSNTLHTWQFTAIPESGSAVNYTRLVSSVGSSGVSSLPIIINTTIVITFSRLSNQNVLPLISRMLISNVSKGLDGVQVECVAATEVATTTIHIIGGRLP